METLLLTTEYREGTEAGYRLPAGDAERVPGRFAADHEVGQREHGEGHVPVPGRPGADLVPVQAHLLAGEADALDRRVLRAGRGHHLCGARAFGGVRQVVGRTPPLARVAAAQHGSGVPGGRRAHPSRAVRGREDGYGGPRGPKLLAATGSRAVRE